MFSSQRSACRLGLSAIVLLGFAGIAAAEPLKPQDVAQSRQTCVSSCVEKIANPLGCNAYCDCSAEGMAGQITQEEYDAGKIALANKQQPAQAMVDKLTAISRSCRPKLEQVE